MYLSLCLIIKDENSYLQEWMDYHILLGVEHFWIYDNESAEPVAATLKDYIDRGRATVNTIQGRAMQLHAYDHCLRTYGPASTWIGFIDADEFIVTHPPERLDTYLKKFEAYGGLAVSSLFYGHGGNIARPAGGQIAAYRLRTPNAFSHNRLIKSIVQPGAVLHPISPHSFLYREGQFCVNEDCKRVDAQDFPCRIKTIQLNHYFTRSQEEWNQKLSRGRGDSPIPYKDERGAKVNAYANVYDGSILELIAALLPEAPKNAAVLAKKARAESPYLLDLLHRATEKSAPPEKKSLPSGQVSPRPELVEYYEEVESGIRLFEEGKLAEARDFWAKQIVKYPFDPLRYVNFSTVSLRQGDFPSAWEALSRAWRIAPRSLFVLLSMSEYFYAIGDYAQVEKTSILAAAEGDLKPEGVALLAISQWKQGKYAEAKKTASPLLDQLGRTEVDNPLFKELINLFSEKKVRH